MDGYDASGVEDDRVAQAARRIVRQYHLRQSDRSEDSGGDTSARPLAAPDDIHGLRLAIDEMSQSIEHMQRLLVNREALFMATLERIDRNLAKTDGRLDAMAIEVARIDSRPTIEADAIVEEQRSVIGSVMHEFSGMLGLSRALLDEAREVHAASFVNNENGLTTGGASAPAVR